MAKRSSQRSKVLYVRIAEIPNSSIENDVSLHTGTLPPLLYAIPKWAITTSELKYRLVSYFQRVACTTLYVRFYVKLRMCTTGKTSSWQRNKYIVGGNDSDESLVAKNIAVKRNDRSGKEFSYKRKEIRNFCYLNWIRYDRFDFNLVFYRFDYYGRLGKLLCRSRFYSVAL